MLETTFAKLDLLYKILANPGQSINQPNLQSIKQQITILEQKIENYLDGMTPKK